MNIKPTEQTIIQQKSEQAPVKKDALETLTEKFQGLEFDSDDEQEFDLTDVSMELDQYEIARLENDEGSKVSAKVSGSAEYSEEILKNGDLDTSGSTDIKSGFTFSQESLNSDYFDLSFEAGVGAGVTISGQNGEYNVDDKSLNFGLGFSTLFKPTDKTSIGLNAKAGSTQIYTTNEDGSDSNSNKQSVEGDINVQVGGLNVKPYVKASVKNSEDSISTEQTVGIEVSQEFEDGSSVGLNAEYSASKTKTEDEYGKNTDTSETLSVGVNATKEFEDNSSLTVGTNYSMDKTTSKYEDSEDPEYSESSSEVNHKVGASVEYKKNNVSLLGELNINPANPREYDGKVGVKWTF